MELYELRTQKSRILHDEARKFLPGGVTYAIKYWEPYPIYVSRAKGSRIWDVDGNEYLDFWMGHAAIIMGHAYEPVIRAAKEQLELGAHLGFCHEWEIKLAEIVTKMVPSVRLFRATNSGTEANMYAIRLARAYTRKSKIAKFEGHWHGGYDALHKAVNPPLDKPASLGLTDCVMNDTIVLPFNDLDGVRQKVKGENLACIILEPVMGSNGMIPADREFLKGLRELCDELDILLIFDEVITGFRLAKGGAQEYYGVLPDITTFGKVLGGGIFPAGGFGGREDIMELLDQTKRKHYEMSFHGGTYAGNPLTARAGYTLLSELIKGDVYPKINALGEKARKGLEDVFSRHKVSAHVTGVGSLFAVHFTKEKPRDIRSAIGDTKLAKDCFYFMLNNNILCMKPSKQVFAPSVAHSEEDIERLLSVMEEFLRQVPI